VEPTVMFTVVNGVLLAAAHPQLKLVAVHGHSSTF
jgi:hypothetical protein